jgi:hypothetical protein
MAEAVPTECVRTLRGHHGPVNAVRFNGTEVRIQMRMAGVDISHRHNWNATLQPRATTS